MTDFDELTQRLISRAEQDVMPHIMISHANDRLALKEKQLQELAEAMRKLDPKSSVLDQYENDAKQAAEEARLHRERTLKEMQEKARLEKNKLAADRLVKDKKKTDRLRYE